MRTYYFKVREKFNDSIRKGKKLREYRLATPERCSIKIGDIIVLISNQNKNDYIRVAVKSVKYYTGWESALSQNWQVDFADICNTYEEVIKECLRYYPKRDVERYGIVVFEIEPITVDYTKARVLLDTNIVIRRESLNVAYDIANLYKWFDKLGIAKYVHALTIEEISKYKDTAVNREMLTKISAYDVLPKYTAVDDAFFNKTASLFSLEGTAVVDNALLREVYDDNVDLLLTDDRLMLLKAERLFIRERVLNSSELLEKYEEAFPRSIEYKMLAVKLKTFGDVDLSDPFFDSLRNDYGGRRFDNWFKKKAADHENAYVFQNPAGLIQGFLYLKIERDDENYSDIAPAFEPKKRIKIGTFKIERSGFRLGERFLKIVFDNARKANVDEVYLTLFEGREDVDKLKDLLMQWGFISHGHKRNGELVLVKDMRVYRDELNPKQNYPLIKADKRYWFLPIESTYHTDLFPDNILHNEDMHLYEDNKAHRYAIEKIYLTGAYEMDSVCPGDLVLIYRKGERWPKAYTSVVTGVAIIEEIYKPTNSNECVQYCKDRSIFDEATIRENFHKYPTVVKLLDLVTFKNKVLLKDLREYGIIEWNSGPRPFTAISEEHFRTIYKIGMEEEK